MRQNGGGGGGAKCQHRKHERRWVKRDGERGEEGGGVGGRERRWGKERSGGGEMDEEGERWVMDQKEKKAGMGGGRG